MGDPNTGDVYRGDIRKSDDIGLSEKDFAELAQQKQESAKAFLQAMDATREANKPDLRTLGGALSFLDYHAPTPDTLPRHNATNEAFQALMLRLWPVIPDGPGKTVVIRAIGRARMECNSCIANGGQ